MSEKMHRVVIIGGGFGGLWATRGLASCPVQVTLIDRANHHLFQPLLYQVATAGLSAPDISAPLRHILRHQRNVEVRPMLTLAMMPGHRMRLGSRPLLTHSTFASAFFTPSNALSWR